MPIDVRDPIIMCQCADFMACEHPYPEVFHSPRLSADDMKRIALVSALFKPVPLSDCERFPDPDYGL